MHFGDSIAQAEAVVIAEFQWRHFDCILIGAGVRAVPSNFIPPVVEDLALTDALTRERIRIEGLEPARQSIHNGAVRMRSRATVIVGTRYSVVSGRWAWQQSQSSWMHDPGRA